MDCRTAQRLISAERDDRLPEGERAALDAHVAACADCRQARQALADAAEVWRAADRAVTAPDATRTWHEVRRKIRTAGGRSSHGAGAAWWMRMLWVAVPAAAAAAIALVVWTRGPAPVPPDAGSPPSSWAKFVEVEDSAAAPVVFIDETTGWVVVWAAEPAGGQI